MIYRPKKSIAPTLLALAIVAGGATAFLLFASQAPTSSAVAALADANLTATSGANGTVSSSVDPDEARLLADIQQIESINLDTTILNQPAFVSFSNFIQSQPQPVGRANPFAPLAGVSASNSSSNSPASSR